MRAADGLLLCLLVSAAIFPGLSSAGPQPRAFQMREDFGTEPLSDCYLQYYYYMPCPTYSWFWGFFGGTYGDMKGAFFNIGDISTGTGVACDPLACHELNQIRILDFGGYGPQYPGLFTVIFEVWCSDEEGCPVGPALWNSGRYETNFAWTYIPVDPPVCLTVCCVEAGPPPSGPRILVTAKAVGTSPGAYPSWGLDNISTNLEVGCELHDISSLGGLYPRPQNSHYETIHSGYYGVDFHYCPPLWFCDGRDTSDDCSQYGFIELAWRIYLSCTGPTKTEPSTWGNIKSMYR